MAIVASKKPASEKSEAGIVSKFPPPARRYPNNAWRVFGAPMLLFLLIPLVALLARTSLQQILLNLGTVEVGKAIALSSKTTFISLIVILVFGTPVAYGLTVRRTKFAKLIDTFVDMPTVLPPSVAGIALLLAFGRMGFVGRWLNENLGITLAFTQVAVILAQVFVASPLYIKAAAIALGTIDHDIKEAAALDGAGTWQIFQHITVPLAWAGLLSGAVMSWARALGEFGATILFAGNLPGVTQTMPLAIYLGFESNIDIAIALSVILMACAFCALLLAKFLLARQPS